MARKRREKVGETVSQFKPGYLRAVLPAMKWSEVLAIVDEVRDDYFDGRLTKEQRDREIEGILNDLHHIASAERN